MCVAVSMHIGCGLLEWPCVGLRPTPVSPVRLGLVWVWAGELRAVWPPAHRLSTLRGMDKIIVLDEGRVVEEGGFVELLERDGVFAEMARKQGLATS